MAQGVSVSVRSPFQRVQVLSARWILGLLVLTAGAWLAGLAGLLAVANRVHDDIPLSLAVKLPLLEQRTVRRLHLGGIEYRQRTQVPIERCHLLVFSRRRRPIGMAMELCAARQSKQQRQTGHPRCSDQVE